MTKETQTNDQSMIEDPKENENNENVNENEKKHRK